MAGESSEMIIEGLMISEKKECLDHNEAEAKIEKPIADLEVTKPCHLDPVQRIKEGFLHFKASTYDKYPKLYQQLAKAQDPKLMVFACADSRVNPSIVLDLQHGDAFVVRNIANTVPAYNKLRYSGVGATLEYALTVLQVENILIMGHSECGGIMRLMSDDDSISYDFLDDWVNLALPAKAKVKTEFGHLSADEQRHICEREAVNLSLVNLLTYPDVKRAVAKNKLALWGAYYDFLNGKFELWEFKSHITPPMIIGA